MVNRSLKKLDNITKKGDTYSIETKHTNGIKIMNKQQALKAMEEATNEMARMTEGSELYKAAKAKHIAAKGALIAIMTSDSEVETAKEIEAAEVELVEIVEAVESRNEELVSKSGFYANSVIGGIASGSITTQTQDETQRIYELKQFLMASGQFLQQAARKRNLERMAKRRGKK